jgi:hypothetical protein
MTEDEGGFSITDPGAGGITLHDPTAANLFLISNGGDDLVTWDLVTGEMTFGQTYTPEGAAKVFWDAVAMTLAQRITWAEEGKCWMCGK